MIWLKVTGNAHEGVCLDWLLQTKVILARGPSGSRADPESPAFIECGCRNLRSSVSPPSSVIWQHFPLPLLNHLWYCCYFLRFPLQIVGFTRLGIILFSFLAPRVLAHTRCTLKIYWCVNGWVGDAVQISHQPDILYLHTLHFARVPLRNLTRLGGAREEKEVTPEQHIAFNTFKAHNAKNKNKKTCTVYFGKPTFSRLSFFWRWLCNSVVGQQPTAVLPPSKLSHRLSGNYQDHTLL